MEKKTLQEKLVDAGYETTFAPAGIDDAFIGVTQDNNAVYDEELIKDIDFSTNSSDEQHMPIIFKRCKLEALDSEVLLIGDGEEAKALSNAIIGVADDGKAVYDYEALIEAFMEYNGWDYEEAVEWYEFNTLRALPYYLNHPYIVTNIEYIL